MRVIVQVGKLNGQETRLSLENVIAEIKSMPQNPANIQPASGLLAQHLANPSGLPDPSFDVQQWNQEWDRIEKQMKAMEIAEQKQGKR